MSETEEWESDMYEKQPDGYDSLLLRLDPRPTLEIIRRNLMRQTKWDEPNQLWYRPNNINARFDEDGIDELMAELHGRMSVDKVLSITDKNEIHQLIREVGEVVLEFIFFNHKDYVIDEKDFTSIYYMILHNVRLFLNRTLGGKEGELITEAVKRRESVVTRKPRMQYDDYDQPNQSTGLTNIFGRYKK